MQVSPSGGEGSLSPTITTQCPEAGNGVVRVGVCSGASGGGRGSWELKKGADHAQEPRCRDDAHGHDTHRAARSLRRGNDLNTCLLYTSPSPRDGLLSRMP